MLFGGKQINAGTGPARLARAMLMSGAGSMLVALAPAAQAQEQAEPEVTPAAEGEILVMARKRSENLQDTPIAITALTGAQLEARNTTKIDTIAQFAPNVVFEPAAPLTGASNNGSVFIRGIGTTEFSLGTEPGVGIYVDGVYLARTSGNVMSLLDVESIEVLRGPQGTLFGRNSVGGAVLLRSKRPAADLGVRFRMEAGTDNLINATAAVDLPISESVRTNFTVQRRSQSGYVRDIARIEDFGRQGSWSGRGIVEVQATDNLRFTTHADYTREKNSAAPFVLVQLFETNPLSGEPTSVALANAGLGCSGGVAGNAGGACVDEYYIRGKHETVFGYSTDSAYLNDYSKRPFNSFDYTKVWGVSETIDLSIGDTDVKSITAYRKLSASNPRNPDHTPFNVLEANSDLGQKQFSQELQISGTAFDERLDWIFGGYYLKETGYQLDAVDIWAVTLHSGGAFKNKSKAAFAQATYKLSDAISLTGGLRYTDEHKVFSPSSKHFALGRTQVIYEFRPFALGLPDATPADPKIAIPPILLINNSTPLDYSEWTPHADISWRIDPNVLTYASYSRGYKAGGFEQRIVQPVAEATTFDVETVDAYELGVKTTLFDRALRLNGAVFYTDYKGLQCSVVQGIAPTIINCGDGTIKGAEVEANYHPTPELTVDFSLGYIDAGWKKASLLPAALAVGITPDSKFAMVPEWTVSGAISYLFELPGGASLTPRVDWSYKSKAFRDSTNTPVLAQSGYHLVDLGVTWQSADERISVTASGKNVFDKLYSMAGVLQPDGGFAEAVYSRGSVWSLILQTKF
ncbi:TonB-dependent receptor [Sphingosinicella sp.]|uniref:TonB-dependent receptor n=1 Tax=Sphingosinicella sp. TaxID=1917971 RepID=UPI0035B482A0